MRLDVGLPDGRDLLDLTDMADLDNYAYPLAARLAVRLDARELVSVWCS
jgi:hypothetical protein